MKITSIHIKQLREEKGITLRTMAKQLGVSASFLSQVERGKSSPSLSTLKNIANALSTTISNLIGENQMIENNPVVRENERKELTEVSQGVSMFLLTSKDANKQMEPLLFKLDEHASSGNMGYKHFGQEFVLVLKGSIEITLNDTRYVLKKGDSIYFNSNIAHSFKNLGKEKAEAVWVVTPPTF
ncbi:MAG: XRE family transcriptional regulator [Candidatus Omnitrophica bacterium]|nr:XRE family transcriptional regulator [Candidatus Omnitrophota bacterium]MDD5081095.1 XRE family transcriptional regulator [Candidatus Omnitrophota bacterium]